MTRISPVVIKGVHEIEQNHDFRTASKNKRIHTMVAQLENNVGGKWETTQVTEMCCGHQTWRQGFDVGKNREQ